MKKILLAILALCSLSFAQTTVLPKTTVFPKTTIFGVNASVGVAAITRVSTSTCSGNFTNSFNCTIAGGITSGKRAIIVLYSNTSFATLTPAITDSGSNTWSTCIQQNANFPTAVCDAAITSSIAAGGTVTISIPGSGGSSGAGAIVYATSSSTGTSGADTSGTAQSAGSTTPSATTAGSLSATDFVFAAITNNSVSSTFSTGAGFTGIDLNLAAQNSYGFNISTEWKTQSSGATATADGTFAPSVGWDDIVGAYKQ